MLYENTKAYLIDGNVIIDDTSTPAAGIIHNHVGRFHVGHFHAGRFHGTYCKDIDKHLGEFISEDGSMFRLTKGGAFELWDDKKGRNDNH